MSCPQDRHPVCVDPKACLGDQVLQPRQLVVPEERWFTGAEAGAVHTNLWTTSDDFILEDQRGDPGGGGQASFWL